MAEYRRTNDTVNLRLLFHCLGAQYQASMNSGANLSGRDWSYLSGRDFPYGRAVRFTVIGVVRCSSYVGLQQLQRLLRTVTQLGRSHIENFQRSLPYCRPLLQLSICNGRTEEEWDFCAPLSGEEEWDYEWIPASHLPYHLR